MMHSIKIFRREVGRAQEHGGRGFALVGAISMLALFALLGTAYVRYMMIEVDDTARHLDVIRAQHLAAGGIYAVIGEIELVLAEGGSPDGHYTISENVYRSQGGERAASAQEVRVSVSDEAARVNVNHAPPAVLRELGLDEDSLANLAKALPTSSGLRSDSRRWLTSVDELRTRGIVNRREFEAIDTDLLTIYSVEDSSKPGGFVNLNSAEPAVLAAVFGIEDRSEIETLAASRPFTTWQDVLTKTGREPSTFNVAPPKYASREMPGELALSSRCYRLRSEVRMNYRGARGRVVSAAVEAVVYFKEDGTYSIRFWNEHPDFQMVVLSPKGTASDDLEETPSSDIDSDETAL